MNKTFILIIAYSLSFAISNFVHAAQPLPQALLLQAGQQLHARQQQVNQLQERLQTQQQLAATLVNENARLAQENGILQRRIQAIAPAPVAPHALADMRQEEQARYALRFRNAQRLFQDAQQILEADRVRALHQLHAVQDNLMFSVHLIAIADAVRQGWRMQNTDQLHDPLLRNWVMATLAGGIIYRNGSDLCQQACITALLQISGAVIGYWSHQGWDRLQQLIAQRKKTMHQSSDIIKRTRPA